MNTMRLIRWELLNTSRNFIRRNSRTSCASYSESVAGRYEFSDLQPTALESGAFPAGPPSGPDGVAILRSTSANVARFTCLAIHSLNIS